MAEQKAIQGIKDLLPRPDQRMLVVGTTGCGKTTLVKHLLRSAQYGRVLVIDPKCTYGGKSGEPGALLIRRPGSLKWLSRKEKLIQFRPDEEHQSVWDYDEVYKWAYRQGDIMVYTDETFLTMNRSYSPDYQRACITCGRELGVGMIFGTQRPRGIDLRILSEAEVMVMFELRHRDDKKRMEEYMGELIWQPLPDYHFFYQRTGMKQPVMATLKLSDKRR